MPGNRTAFSASALLTANSVARLRSTVCGMGPFDERTWWPDAEPPSDFTTVRP